MAKTGYWIGHIDRTYFDGQLSEETFYSTYKRIFSPTQKLTCNAKESGTDTLYFRYSFIYDGNQESLLSPPVKVSSCDKTGWVQLYLDLSQENLGIYRTLLSGTATATVTNMLQDSGQFALAESEYIHRHVNNTAKNTIAKVTEKYSDDSLILDDDIMTNGDTYILFSHNRRITGINIYYSEQVMPKSLYKLCHTIDFLRNGSNISSGSVNIGWVNGSQQSLTLLNDKARIGRFLIVKASELSDVPGYYSGWHLQAEPSITIVNEYTITDGTTTYALFLLDGTLTTTLLGDSGALEDPSNTITDSFTEGYGGLDLIYAGNTSYYVDLSDYSLIGSSLYSIGKSLLTSVKAIEKMCIQTNDNLLATGDSASEKGVIVGTPLYTFHLMENYEPIPAFFTVVEMENNIETNFPLGDEVSISVNGKYAIMLKGRLIQGNIALSPDGVNEIHPDWISYSELDQLDVNPVSNVISIPNSDGGEITGIVELFGRAVVAQKLGLHLLSMTSPSDPSAWTFSESIHNIGNVAENGLISVHGRVYVVSYDGIYELAPNNLAQTDSTPTEQLKISEPINDLYLAITDSNKEAGRSWYNQKTNEVCFYFSGTTVYAFSLINREWRTIYAHYPIDTLFADKEGNVLFYSEADEVIYALDGTQNITYYAGRIPEFATKTFNIATEDDTPRIVRYITVNYKSAGTLTLSVYADNDTTAVNTYTLPAKTTLGSYSFAVRYWCKKLKIKIEETSASDDDVWIDRVEIDVD
jgi:hypothetical protein